VALAQPVFLLWLAVAVFVGSSPLFEQHVARLEEARGALVDVLSHDLRNPLSTARVQVETLEREHPERADEFTELRVALARAGDVMEDGLLYSRLWLDRVERPTDRLDVGLALAAQFDQDATLSLVHVDLGRVVLASVAQQRRVSRGVRSIAGSIGSV